MLGRQPLTPPPAIVAAPDGSWVTSWLSPARHSRYLTAANGDRGKALALYEWNAQTSAAFSRDLAHVEVALRNAYDIAATSRWTGQGHWLKDDHRRVFAPLMRSRGNGNTYDVNRKPRLAVDTAVDKAGGSAATPGKVVAELSFGFWRYLSSSAHEKALWIPLLHFAFPAGTNRADVDRRVGTLHLLRNRCAHHEPLLNQPLAQVFQGLIDVSQWLHPDLGLHIAATSTVPQLLTLRP